MNNQNIQNTIDDIVIMMDNLETEVGRNRNKFNYLHFIVILLFTYICVMPYILTLRD